MNPKQSLLFDSYYKIGSMKLLLPIASISMVYFHFFNQRKVNRDLLFFYFGILFTATIFFIYPAPAWYVWLVPFITIYFIQNENQQKSKLLYGAFSTTYIVFFFFFYQPEYKDIFLLQHEVNFKINNQQLANIFFTFLESMLLAVMYTFYRYGIKSNTIYKKQTNLTIGIGGDSGVGKSSLLSSIQQLLGDKLLQIEGDGEHKWERGDDNWSKLTHLDPKANHIHKQANAIYDLKHNLSIYRSEYDHHSGKFTQSSKVEPREFIAISGLHPFYLPKLRKMIDLKIYLDTDETLRRHWKIIRDTEKRGYSKETILQQIEERKEDTLKYIYPQKNFADLIISFFAIQEINLGDVSQKIDLGLKISIDASIHLEELLKILECKYVWDYNDDLHTQFIEFHNEPNIDYTKTAAILIPNIHEIVTINPIWEDGYNGLVQLVILMMLSEKLQEGLK
jgi:uridine kinase